MTVLAELVFVVTMAAIGVMLAPLLLAAAALLRITHAVMAPSE